jgi:hypothetical protein
VTETREYQKQLGGVSQMTETERLVAFRKIDHGAYAVMFGKTVLGEVYRDEHAWSYGNWFISGDRREKAVGGVNSKSVKYLGFTDRSCAAKELAIMQSGLILAKLGRSK